MWEHLCWLHGWNTAVLVSSVFWQSIASNYKVQLGKEWSAFVWDNSGMIDTMYRVCVKRTVGNSQSDSCSFVLHHQHIHNQQNGTVALAALYMQHKPWHHSSQTLFPLCLLLLLSCPYENTGFSCQSTVITSCYSYLSPHLGVLLLPGGGRRCLALMNPCRLPKTPL